MNRLMSKGNDTMMDGAYLLSPLLCYRNANKQKSK